MDAKAKSINDIFNGNRILEIPFFQRAYVWEEMQWERLLEDMEETSKQNIPYFLGAVILKQQMQDTKKAIGDIRTLIDGQQRLTTLSIFLKVLCLKNNENPRFERVFKIDENIALTHNHNDINNYNEILNLQKEIEIDKTNNISKAYTYFKDNVKPEKLNYRQILNNIEFVVIDLGKDEDEQQIFNTINSLGVRLTTAELLKNHFFGRDDLDLYDANWKQIFERDDESKEFWDTEVPHLAKAKRENIDLFFYSFLQIKLQDKNININCDDKKKLSTFSNLFENYKEFMKIYSTHENISIQKVKNLLIQEIKEYALLYRDNIDNNIIDRELTGVYGIERINAIIFGLEYTGIIPFVLYVLNNTKENKEEQNNIFMYLESYLMRRIISKSNNNNLNYLFSGRLISKEITSKEKFQNLINEKTDHNNSMPSNEVVKNGFLNSKLTNKQTKGIIYLIESIIRVKNKHSTGLLGLNKYTLEHIMPKKWEKHWSKVATDDERSYRNKKLLTLGNLTIITSSLNSSVKNLNWDKKKNGTDKYSGLKKFTSGIETIDKYLQYEDWNEDTITERAEFLYEKAMKIWTL